MIKDITNSDQSCTLTYVQKSKRRIKRNGGGLG
jgi:hypothetical protein